jgi:hypothetical protein
VLEHPQSVVETAPRLRFFLFQETAKEPARRWRYKTNETGMHVARAAV